MERAHLFLVDKIKLGKKGQITLPKKIREEDKFEEGDMLSVIHMPSGDIILRKQMVNAPEDLMLEAIRKAPLFDWRAAWEEVREERKRERS